MKVDYIIVGQGVAGTLLAYFLKQEGKKVVIFDPGYERAASQVAAGIINPITGRRYVKSWRVDELIPFAKDIYRKLEVEFGISIYHEQHIIRTLFNQREENDWLSRTGDPGYETYMLEQAELGPYATYTEQAFSYGEVCHSAQVDIGVLANTYREVLDAEGAFHKSSFDYELLKITSEGVSYQDISASTIVFCEGARAVANPFFNYLPFAGAKGDVLLIRIPGQKFEKIIKHRIFLVPMMNDLYWVGATYDRKYEDDLPTTTGRAFLEERLADFLKLPYEVVTHKAAIRPTVKDRRPFLGRHPEHRSLAIFNGLGTKGASLAPFWAKHMAEFLLKKRKLDKAVDIKRF